MVYLVGGEKGGVGKTTTAINLAIYLSQEKNRDVLFVDADAQASASEFMAWRAEHTQDDNLTFVQLTRSSVRDEVKKLRSKFDDIIIDAGGGMRDSQKFALVVADKYLVPFPASGPDIWTLTKVERIVEEALAFNENLKSYSFLMKAYPEGSENKDAAEVLQDSKVIEYLDYPIISRKAFSQSVTAGYSIFDYKLKNHLAAEELSRLFEEIS